MLYQRYFYLAIIILIFLILMRVYIINIITTRNESEYKDIVEYQTMLVANILTQNPSILSSIGKLRYFPDKSGFFIILDYSGKILVNGDYDGDLAGPLPFDLPTANIVDTAKQGGGYIIFNYKGNIFQLFIYSIPSSPYIVCSGIFTDVYHIDHRQNTWKRKDRILPKKGRGFHHHHHHHNNNNNNGK